MVNELQENDRQVPSRSDFAMAYSATAVLPADVCAATRTLSPNKYKYIL